MCMYIFYIHTYIHTCVKLRNNDLSRSVSCLCLCVVGCAFDTSQFQIGGKSPAAASRCRQRKGMSLNPRHVTTHCPMPEQQDSRCLLSLGTQSSSKIPRVSLKNRWYGYHSQMAGFWHCFTHITQIQSFYIVFWFASPATPMTPQEFLSPTSPTWSLSIPMIQP